MTAQPRDSKRFWYPPEIDVEYVLEWPPCVEEIMLEIVRAIEEGKDGNRD
jgi:hypothetical protein